jgi:hypothetical protein
VRKIITGVVAVAALAACGSNDPTAKLSPSATTEQAASFGSVTDLRAAVEATGYVCDKWDVVTDPDNALERAHCTDQVVFSIYADEAQLETHATEFVEVTAGFGVDMESVWLVGDTWSINCGEHMDLCGRFARSMGQGDIRELAPEQAEGSDYVPTADDFMLTVKILEQECFGSAGCNVRFRVELTHLGGPNYEDLDAAGRYELTYEIEGGEDPYINTLEITGDEYSQDDRQRISTESSDFELTAVVLDVTDRS